MLIVGFQIFEDGALYRGRMKIMAREVFKFHYKDTLDAGIDGCHNSNQQDEAISENVKKIIDKSLFLQGPLDAQVNSSGSLQVFLAAPLMLHQNRAVRKILDTLQLLILLSTFTIMGSQTAFPF